jgi:hypothetical protein
MEVEPPPAAAAAAVLKCLGLAEPIRLDEAAAGPPQEPTPEDGATPATPRDRAQEESLRRGLLAARARRKAGRATPSPSWKLEASPPRPEAEEAAAPAGTRSSTPAASARQLGATLWEIQDVIRVAGAGRRIRRRGRRAPTGGEAGAGADRVSTLCWRRRLFRRHGQHDDV